MGFLDTLGLSSSQQDKYAKKAQQATLAGIDKATGAVRKGTTQAVGAINTGATGATAALAPAITAAGTYVNTQNQGYNTYADAMGLNGPEGTARAEAAYRASLQPGEDLGTQSILRNNAAAGGLRSGDTSTDLADYEYNTRYQPWVTGLKEFDPYQAIALQGNLGEAQGNIYTGEARDLSGLYTGQASALANLNLGAGAANAGLYNQYATNLGQVGQNWGNLAGNILTAGATLAGGPAGGMAARTLFGPAGTGRITGNIGDNPNWNVS